MLNDTASLPEPLDTAISVAYDRYDWPSFARGYEMKGFYFLKMNQIDSSEQNLIQCNEAMNKYSLETNFAAGVLMPDYYLAQIRVKQNRINEARELLEPDIERLSNFKFEALKEYKLLIELYLQLNDAKSAGVAFQKYSAIQAQIKEEDRKNRFLSFETEKKISEAENTIGTLESDKKLALLIRNFTMGIAVLLMIVAGIIFNRFRVTHKQKIIIEKEKQRSEELLLNILPSEVAEELKEKGSADAKQFESVTVMFTDFKGFTQIAEKLSPTELVNEIHTCFKAFDEIISKHNLEKIKTIGDAYMCAGGLPVVNKTHASDVVKAALEIQQLMNAPPNLPEGEESQRAGQVSPSGRFRGAVRIGIHTGPVVAGIVGVKKFAYDIWGDTVNIASRMESSGEAGKVNVSGSTFELVKDKFICNHRGKIQAKNKGEIDMYFVEADS
jgi:class 3 adenylate cyclase